MNIEQQRSNFETYELKKKPSANPKILFQRFEIEDLGSDERKYAGQYISHDMQEKWELWLAAQQQEGYVLVPTYPTEQIKQRMLKVFNESDRFLNCENIYKAMIQVVQE